MDDGHWRPASGSHEVLNLPINEAKAAVRMTATILFTAELGDEIWLFLTSSQANMPDV